MQMDVLDAQRDEAQAQSQQAVTEVASAEAQVVARKSDTASAQAVVSQRTSELDAAQRRFSRSETFAKYGALALRNSTMTAPGAGYRSRGDWGESPDPRLKPP